MMVYGGRPVRFNAWSLSRAWVSVALAQSANDARPALYRSTLIEMFDDGIRLVSTDGYVLLKAWVADIDADADSEPGIDVLPDDVAICSDRDHRVLGLMKYIQSITKADGSDSPVEVEMGLGTEAANGNQSTLEGMAQSTVFFHLTEQYDERIESPIFEGVFPNWRPLWANHRWQPTSVIGFGANGILRLGRLSALWDKAAIEFELGGTVGVAKIKIIAPDVFVSGLVMPVTTPDRDDDTPVEHDEMADALDDFISDVLRSEVPDGDDTGVNIAVEAQLQRCLEHVVEVGYANVRLLAASMNITDERAAEIIESFVADGYLAEPDESGNHETLLTAADLADTDDYDGEEPL
jgi:hypothetical protein